MNRVRLKRKSTTTETTGARPIKSPESREVKVSIIFTHLGEINTLKEIFSCEALLFVSWREPIHVTTKSFDYNSTSQEPKDFWNPQLYIDNAIGEVKEVYVKFWTDKLYDQSTGECYFQVHSIKKIKGSFFEKLEFYNFPFDVQDLSLILTSHRTCDELYITQDFMIPARMTKSASVDKHIWVLYEHVNFKTLSHANESTRQSIDPYESFTTYSSLIIQCRVSRKASYYVLNCLLPVFMITTCIFFTFMIKYEKYQYRYHLLFYSMLTSITFRWAVHGRVMPPVSYMTFLDVYCVSSMVFVFAAMIWHTVFISMYNFDPGLAVECDKYALLVFFLIVIIEHLIQFVWWSVAMQRRRDLEKLDESAAQKFLEKRRVLMKENETQLKADNIMII